MNQMWSSPLGEESHSLALQPCCKSALTESSCCETLPRAGLWAELGWELPILCCPAWSELSLYPTAPRLWGRGHWWEELLGPAAPCWRVQTSSSSCPFRSHSWAQSSREHTGVWHPAAGCRQHDGFAHRLQSGSLPRLQTKGALFHPTAPSSPC